MSSYLQTKKVLLFQCCTDVVNLLLNDNDGIKYGRLSAAEVCVILPLTFTGFIVMNGVSSVFKSYLTLPIYERQIKTIEDLFNSKVPIIANDVGYGDTNFTVKFLENALQRGRWTDKVSQVNTETLKREAWSFNSTIAFTPLFSEAQRLLEAQRRLNLKAYYLITQPYLLKVFETFHVSLSFAFFGHINEIIHYLQSAG